MTLGSEAGKAAGQILVDTAADGRGIIKRLFEPAVTELGETLGDQTRFWRFKNLARIMEKVQQIADDRRIPPEHMKALPFGDAIRTVEAASYEEDEAVQDLWSRLIANATTGDGIAAVRKAHVEILESLSASEAALLELLWTCENEAFFQSAEAVDSFNLTMDALADARWRKFSDEARLVAIQNLIRLRCITFRPRTIDANGVLAVVPREIIANSGFAVVDHHKFDKLLQQLVTLIFASADITPYAPKGAIPVTRDGGLTPYVFWNVKVTVPEMNHMLTAMGKELMRACDAKVVTM